MSGTASCPRLSVFRSAKHISVQAIDDCSRKTISSVSSTDKKISMDGNRGNKKNAEKVGEIIAAQLVEKGIKKVVFDRNGYLYHGRVQSLANSARKGGLVF